MADTLTTSERSARMGRIGAKNTKPELLVRRLVHAMGHRYRLHRGDLPGSPDLVFGPAKKVIFVHGCFWHRHSDPSCKLARLPKSRLDFWRDKLDRNRSRDEENEAHLHSLGWKVLIIWECQLKDESCLATIISQFLGTRREVLCAQ